MIKLRSEIGNHKRKILRKQVTLDKITISQNVRTKIFQKQCLFIFNMSKKFIYSGILSKNENQKSRTGKMGTP